MGPACTDAYTHMQVNSYASLRILWEQEQSPSADCTFVYCAQNYQLLFYALSIWVAHSMSWFPYSQLTRTQGSTGICSVKTINTLDILQWSGGHSLRNTCKTWMCAVNTTDCMMACWILCPRWVPSLSMSKAAGSTKLPQDGSLKPAAAFFSSGMEHGCGDEVLYTRPL